MPRKIDAANDGGQPHSTRCALFVQAKVLGAFKLARFAYDRLQRQRVPPFWQDQIDLDMLTVQVCTYRLTEDIVSATGLSLLF